MPQGPVPMKRLATAQHDRKHPAARLVDRKPINTSIAEVEKKEVKKAGVPKAQPSSANIKSSAKSGLPSRTPYVEKKKSLALNNRPTTAMNSKAKSGLEKRRVSAMPTASKKTKEETKYKVIEGEFHIEDLEVFSDFSYDEDTDIDRPEGTTSVTCTTEIVDRESEQRRMVIRKQYYLKDGRELRVKNIRPIKAKTNGAH